MIVLFIVQERYSRPMRWIKDSRGPLQLGLAVKAVKPAIVSDPSMAHSRACHQTDVLSLVALPITLSVVMCTVLADIRNART